MHASHRSRLKPGWKQFYGCTRCGCSDVDPGAHEVCKSNPNWRDEECFMCGHARKIVVHSDGALDEYHPFVEAP